jgi:hypothetical protein
MSTLAKVISGGQSGADMAALEAAKACGLLTGGVAPEQYITANGKKPELGTEFGLRELIRAKESLAQMYVRRSQLNVDESEATVAFRLQPSVGTDKTIGYCQSGKWAKPDGGKFAKKPHRPHLVVRDVSAANAEATAREIVEFVRLHKVAVLNVAGHRDDVTAGVAQFQAAVFSILKRAFEELKSDI